jgi:hypothetical protein
MAVLKAIDCSSHQPRNLTSLIQTHRPDHVIVKGYLPIESISQEHTRAQVRSARDNGCSVGLYCWAYRSADPIKTIDDIIVLCASMDLVLPLLWIDCETYDSQTTHDPGPDADWLAKAVHHAENTYGMACGIYTGKWWVDGHFPGGQGEFAKFNRLPLWLSHYDDVPDIDRIRLPLGWDSVAAKQYTSNPIDLNVIREEYTVYQVEPDPDPVDPCEDVKADLAHVSAERDILKAEIDDIRVTVKTVIHKLEAELDELESVL